MSPYHFTTYWGEHFVTLDEATATLLGICPKPCLGFDADTFYRGASREVRGPTNRWTNRAKGLQGT